MKKTLKEHVIGVIQGGYSLEREVSIRSGEAVTAALERLGYSTVVIDPINNLDDLNRIDIAFLVLHGKGGEDGALQGLLDRLSIPYTGSSAATSALALNKLFTKKCLEAHGFPVVPYRVSSATLTTLPDSFEYPVIIKPIDDGSSMGVYVIDDNDELAKRSSELVQLYKSFLLEAFFKGREITVSVVKGKETRVFPILELKSKNRIYDFEAKYTPGMTELICPSQLPEPMYSVCSQAALDIFNVLDCSGAARVDMIVQDEHYVVLEVNTLPGMTATSDLPAQAKAAGILFDDLVEMMLESVC